MIPLVRASVLKLGAAHVTPFVLPCARLRQLEVGRAYDELPIVALVVERPEDGVEFVDVEDTSGPHEGGGYSGPRAHVRQPVQRADPGVDYVERLAERRRRVVEVRVYEAAGNTAVFGKPACRFDRW